MALAVPVTLKTTEEGENKRLDYAVSAMQGYRANMEDAHAIVLNLDAATGTSFFGVYDGHGGPAVSKYCGRHLQIELLRHESFRDNLQTATERTFLRMDEMELSVCGGNDNWKPYRKATVTILVLPFCQNPAYQGPESDGCTACVLLIIRGNQIIVGNAGDSRCVLSRNNLEIELSTDFKPNLPAERQRIQATGHLVTFSQRGNAHRIDDGIAISRSLGDLRYKDNYVLGTPQRAITAFPEVRTEEITQDDQFLIIACDGIWDYTRRQQEVDLLRIYSTVVVYRMLKQGALIAKFINTIRNTVTFVLDGDNYDVWEQYILVMAHIRFWFVSKGETMNLRPVLGYDKFIHMVPEEGTLHVVLRYGSKSINLVIDAMEAWLHGAVGAKAVVHFKRINSIPYIQHEYSIPLNGEGKYSQVGNGEIGEIPIGIDALRTLCSVVAEVDENSDLKEIERQSVRRRQRLTSRGVRWCWWCYWRSEQPRSAKGDWQRRISSGVLSFLFRSGRQVHSCVNRYSVDLSTQSRKRGLFGQIDFAHLARTEHL